MIQFARRLQNRFALNVVSNGDFGSRYVVDLLHAHYGISFRRCYSSSEIGAKKPLLLEAVKKEISTNYSLHLYVDDIAQYVQVAHKLGFSAIQYDARTKPPHCFQDKLRDFGIAL